MRFSKTNNIELALILFHIFLGVAVFFVPLLSKLYNLIVFSLFLYFIVASKNKVVAVLIATSYMATSDVFFRMTNGLFFYELHKYSLILFVLIGVVLDGVKLKGYVYLIYVSLLLLTIVFTSYDFTEEVRKMIAFNLAGPVSLGLVAFYFYKKKVSVKQLHNVLFYGLLPIISMVIYMFLYTPSIKEVVTGTASNFATSGGFGPNQVATILGVGIFILFARLLLNTGRGLQQIIELILLSVMLFRGLVTFSRGGILTAFGAILVLLAITYFRGKQQFKIKLFKLLILSVILGLGIWFYAVNRTSGLLDNRYANENAFGEKKEDISTGRKDLFLIEVQAFFENPVLGIGVGRNKGYRYERTGHMAASHNEISRLLAEHGSLGIMAFFILVSVPLLFRLENKKNIYFYSFFLFWLLTINHSAMRIAFPSFIYGLCLLDIVYVPRQQKKQISA